jgi:hypothetical protein
MNKFRIHQIFYSKETFEQLDPGFIPLDNSDGRSDWREYWPIREYFLNNKVEGEELIGFFSPRFFEKTGLKSDQVFECISSDPGMDVYLFNPYYHLASWHLNIFMQAEKTHKGIINITNSILKLLGIELSVERLVMSSLDTIYCNYFVANIKFWKDWLIICDFIYQLSESENSDISSILKSDASYHRGLTPMKVFLIERIASIILNINKDLNISRKVLLKDVQYLSSKNIQIIEILKILDENKIKFQKTGCNKFLKNYQINKDFYSNEYNLII